MVCEEWQEYKGRGHLLAGASEGPSAYVDCDTYLSRSHESFNRWCPKLCRHCRAVERGVGELGDGRDAMVVVVVVGAKGKTQSRHTIAGRRTFTRI